MKSGTDIINNTSYGGISEWVNLNFAELEEEEELEKLISWYGKIKARDIFNSSQRDYAEEKIYEIKKAFENYSDMVFSHDNK